MRCPSGSRAIRRAVAFSSLSIPDSSMISADASSDKGGEETGEAVARPAMAPWRSARVSPPAGVVVCSPEGTVPPG